MTEKTDFCMEMKRIKENTAWDEEDAHIHADQVLCDAVLELAREAGREEEGEALIALYGSIGKWYA